MTRAEWEAEARRRLEILPPTLQELALMRGLGKPIVLSRFGK